MITTRLVGEQWIDDFNEFKQDAYTLTDVKLSYRYKFLEASFAVRNLFDEDYASFGENWGGGEAFLTPGDPRTFFGQLTMRF
jgi:outer membrane receptor protein involved in Fe transport